MRVASQKMESLPVYTSTGTPRGLEAHSSNRLRTGEDGEVLQPAGLTARFHDWQPLLASLPPAQLAIRKTSIPVQPQTPAMALSFLSDRPCSDCQGLRACQKDSREGEKSRREEKGKSMIDKQEHAPSTLPETSTSVDCSQTRRGTFAVHDTNPPSLQGPGQPFTAIHSEATAEVVSTSKHTHELLSLVRFSFSCPLLSMQGESASCTADHALMHQTQPLKSSGLLPIDCHYSHQRASTTPKTSSQYGPASQPGLPGSGNPRASCLNRLQSRIPSPKSKYHNTRSLRSDCRCSHQQATAHHTQGMLLPC